MSGISGCGSWVVVCRWCNDRVKQVVINSLVVVVDGHRQHFLGVVLSYDVLVEVRTNLTTDITEMTTNISSSSNSSSIQLSKTFQSQTSQQYLDRLTLVGTGGCLYFGNGCLSAAKSSTAATFCCWVSPSLDTMKNFSHFSQLTSRAAEHTELVILCRFISPCQCLIYIYICSQSWQDGKHDKLIKSCTSQ